MRVILRFGCKYIVGLIFLMPMVIVNSNAAEHTFLSAIITTDKGAVKTDKLLVNEYQIEHGASITIKSSGGEMIRTNIPYDKISSIVISNVSTGNNSSQLYISGQLNTKDGRSFMFAKENSFFTLDELEYFNPNPITGKLEKQGISYYRVKEIKLMSINGPFMVDSSEMVFPPDYVYSPYSGEKLVPQKMPR